MHIVGTINPIETLPSFVIPIFDKQGMYYYQYFKDLEKTEVGFEPIVIEGEVCDTFKMLSETIDSAVMQYAFKLEDESVYLGEYRDMKDFLFEKLESFKSDFFLYVEVCEFLGEYQLELDAFREFSDSDRYTNGGIAMTGYVNDKIEELKFIIENIKKEK